MQATDTINEGSLVSRFTNPPISEVRVIRKKETRRVITSPPTR